MPGAAIGNNEARTQGSALLQGDTDPSSSCKNQKVLQECEECRNGRWIPRRAGSYRSRSFLPNCEQLYQSVEHRKNWRQAEDFQEKALHTPRLCISDPRDLRTPLIGETDWARDPYKIGQAAFSVDSEADKCERDGLLTTSVSPWIHEWRC